MSKQDRQGARTPAALERKYGFGQRFGNQDQTNKYQDAETAALAARLETHIQNSNSALERIAQDLTQVKATVSSLEKRYSSLNEDVDKNFTDLNEAISGMERIAAELQDTTTVLTSMTAEQREEISRMKTRLSIYDDKFTEIYTILAEMSTGT